MQKGARAIILKDGKILLGKRLKKDSFYGLWCTFGGSIETGETPTQALKRELKEELGIDILEPEFLATTETTIRDEPQEVLQLHFFLVKEWKGKIINGGEHSEIKWFSPEELKDLPMGWIGKKTIQKYLKKPFL